VPILEQWVATTGHELRIVDPSANKATLDMSTLDSRQRAAVVDLARVIGRLDAVLLVTIEQQLSLWRSIIPTDEEVTGVSPNVTKNLA
jgi:hypothetical protein